MLESDDWTIDDYINRKLFHEIHTGERRSFKSCRRRWDWHFRRSLYPPTTLKVFEFGTAYHIGMEVYYNPDTFDWDNEVRMQLAIKAFVDSCEEQRAAALAANIFYDEEVEQDYNERVELGKGMLTYYCSVVAPKIDVGWRPIKTEIAFMVPIKNPETNEEVIWCKCDTCWRKQNKFKPWEEFFAWDIGHTTSELRYEGYIRANYWKGLPVVFAGRIDLIVQDRFGNYWLWDWKTAKNVTDEENADFLELDQQIDGYIMATRKLGLNIQGFIYHEQRKGYPQRPKENLRRRNGCKFSVNKQQDVDFETFMKTVAVDDTEAFADGAYDEFLTFLREEGIVYYSRRQVLKTPEEDESVEENLGLEALDMIDPNLRIYHSPGRFTCRGCAFKIPCVEKNSKGDYEYALKTLYEVKDHYYVRQTEGPSTESQRND